MTVPSADTLFEALEATWPPARAIDAQPFRLRDGQGGGQRVSSAVCLGTPSDSDIARAEAAMQDLGQSPLFMLRDGDTAFDEQLVARGYTVSDPTKLYVIQPATIARSSRPGKVFPAWPPFAIQREIWECGGVGPARQSIMDRAAGPKTSLLCRIQDTPAATVFAAMDGPIAMLHALEVLPLERRKGLGESAVRATAHWAVTQGADWLALAVTKANTAANALYQKLGMQPAGAYHYRRAPGAAS